ncbi:type II/IV secretion system ATPase subunit [Methanococcoides sp.]|uniref:type II/IV secretion system ATPase subunit n=1 Tax=Methanococcoides sp. TaxID=1966350 RepID=UPI00272EC938|nr:type II/IV secretion system ATPase subunit [Methanococcoides sp.]
MIPITKNVKALSSRLLSFKKHKEHHLYNPAADGDLVSFTPSSDLEELERYWIDEPYSFISIVKTKQKEVEYKVIEPELDSFEILLIEEIHDVLKDVLTLEGVCDIDNINSIDKCKLLREKTEQVLSEYAELEIKSFEKIFYYVRRDFIEFGKISAIMRDPNIEDIWCNGVNMHIHVFHIAYGSIPTNIVFNTSDELNSFVMRIAQQSGRHLSASTPILDTVMRDGSRINITYGQEISPNGSSFSIRRLKKTPLTPLDLVAWHTFSSEMMAYFWFCVENHRNIIFCGSTASGKTSSLNAIGMFIPPNKRIVSLEDTKEIQLPHDNWISTITRDGISTDNIGKVDLDDLLRSSLRQRPEYLIVGEVRGKEAQTLFQAMNAGHSTCSTFHAGSASEVINRFTNPPINIPEAMFSALDIICVQINAYNLGVEKRRVAVVSEIVRVANTIETEDSFVWDQVTDSFENKASHVLEKGSNVLEDIKRTRGWSNEDLRADLNRRMLFLDSLIAKGIRDYESVAQWINLYYKDPEKVLSDLSS